MIFLLAVCCGIGFLVAGGIGAAWGAVAAVALYVLWQATK